ncbi:hypothetical protein AK812_SmicGene15952 [Symbiodinium microadriaticum]|uniref:Uncharacterized protein n=1 Tax=Symbiodinium microadriaticum TaxID=2951 RepID=A0A1Q9E1L0_SYMMI|nr:hypothetical protein AK812_SmicGene15952 [Symbiodinium microadriaticum]
MGIITIIITVIVIIVRWRHADALSLLFGQGKLPSSFMSLFGSKEDDVAPEGQALPNGNCPKLRPAQLARASCPGVGAEMEIRRREGIDKDTGGCPAQPPACCEAAKRAEAAAKMVEDQIRANPFLRWMQMRQVPSALLLLGPPMPEDGKRQRAQKVPADFIYRCDVSAQELHRRCWCCGDMAGGRKKERKAQVAKPGKRPSKKAWRKADVEDVEETMEDERLVAKLKKQVTCPGPGELCQ